MADSGTLEDRMRQAFSVVGIPQTSVLVEKPFSNDDFKALPMYQYVNPLLSDNDLHLYGNHLVSQLKGDVSNTSIGKLLLLLALNVRSPNDGESNLNILKDLHGTNISVLQANSIGYTRPVVKTTEEPQVPSGKDAAGTSEKPESTESLLNTVNQEYQKKLNREAMEFKPLTCTPSFIPFLAAYILKSHVKSPDNIILGEEKMKSSYIRFYKEAVSLSVGLDNKSIEVIGERLRADPKIITTWIYATATHEGTASSTDQGSGVIRFLANLPFSFNGMQAYGLFREALIHFEPNPTELMIKLYMSETKPAINEIHRIMQNYETLSMPDGTVKRVIPYFKYARLLNPEYFAKLQPTRCTGLIYILVKLLKSCVEYSALADPEKIMALKKLGKARKEYFDAHVQALLEGVTEDDTEATAVAKKAAIIRAAQRRAAPVVEQEMRQILGGRI